VLVTGNIDELKALIRAHRADGRKISLVPTMGYLHEGHLRLVDLAKERSDIVVMSIFVNPTQFGLKEDFQRYPRDIPRDLKLADGRGVHIIFSPEVETMYPGGTPLSFVDIHRLTDSLCGASRPGHFRGVLTVVAKLLHIVEPDIAVFGRKDIQQLVVIERMARELDFPVEIVGAPTVRERDGLAISSRNIYLSRAERAEAVHLYQALLKGRELIRGGERAARRITSAMEKVLAGPATRIDYLSAVNYLDLQPIEVLREKGIVALAAFVGSTRLIDNFIVEFTDGEPSFSI